MRLLILFLLFAPYRTPPCTEPPTASPCINSDGAIRRHTVEEWKAIEARRNEAAFFADLIAAAKRVGKGMAEGEPLPWAMVGTGIVVVLILQWMKRGVSRVERNFNEQRNIAIDAIELAERYERELKRRKAA